MHPLLRLPYAVAGHAAVAASHLPLNGDGKVARSLRERRDALAVWEEWGRARRDPSRPLVWMHAPSVGEGLQARPVLELVRARHPDWQLAYSHYSPSAAAFVRGLDVDARGYLPFDTASAARRMLAALRPSAVVFAKLDAWPLLCEAAANAGVPLGMVSATAGPQAARRGPVARALLRDAHAAFRAVGAISFEDASRLVALGFPASAVAVTGDTRYDQVAARTARVDRSAGFVGALASPRPTLVAGSTWPSDEEVLLPSWAALRARHPGLRLIVAPHEPTEAHLAPVEQWGAQTGIAVTRLGAATSSSDVVLVDRVGVLGDLYALGSAAWVGGGFHAAGLHSVLEPAAYGIPVAFGPRHLNSRDAGLLLAAGGGSSVANVATATRTLEGWLADETAARAAGARARAVVESGLGAAERAYELVRTLVTG